MLTKEQLAQMLDGRAYRNEITREEVQLAKDNGLVVVFGYSDDNCELVGAIDDEIGCYEGGTLYFSESGLLENECDDDECPYFEQQKENAKTIEILWCEEDGYSWTYKTEIPHATFDIMEDGDKYCRGIVFSIDDLKGSYEMGISDADILKLIHDPNRYFILKKSSTGLTIQDIQE